MVEIELFFYTSSAQYNYDSAIVKLELYGNISLIPNANELKRCGKAIYGIESSFTKQNSSIIEGAKLFSAECNLPVIQGVDLSSIEHNVFVPTKLLIIDDTNNIELRVKTMIKANGHFFKSMFTVSKYIETFDFGKNCFMVQI